MFYLLNKKKGLSSFKAIREFAKENNIKKIGHTGTLDPMASGLLLVATDEDTKLIDYVDKGSKRYIATMSFGKSSDTLDSEGEITQHSFNASEEQVKEALMSFVKTYSQVPPRFSARKVNGKRAYDLAREGKEFELKSSTVTISNISNITFLSKTDVKFEVEVSRGTYIRSLIRDVAESINEHAIMTDLIRNEVAGFTLDKAESKIADTEVVKLSNIQIDNMKDLFDGKPVHSLKESGRYAVIYEGYIVGIIEIENNQVKKRRLFGSKYERLLNESN